ncbi:MAG: CDP-archaeol synthase [Candidatus Magasanikbacteria bacterium]
MIFKILLQIIWFLLPAGFANMAPVLVRKINFLNYPIDGGRIFFGERLFGSNKTWRGLFFGIIFSILTVFIQSFLYSRFFAVRDISFFSYFNANICLVGFLFGAGALIGDLIKSFFKRRFHIASGKSWVPFDQIDWILGSLIAISLIINLPWYTWLYALLFFGFLHPVVNIIGYWLKIKPNRF